MDFNYYVEETKKLNDICNANDLIVPALHTWRYQKKDETLHEVSYPLPFDMYSIPRAYADVFVRKYSPKLHNAVYILGGNGHTYVGKSENADRISAHNKDTDKKDWLYQLLFIPNNEHSFSKKNWTDTFMELLESLLIEKFISDYDFQYNTDRFLNKQGSLDFEKAKDKLNNNEEVLDFANIVIEYIIKAYVAYSKDTLGKTQEIINNEKAKKPKIKSSDSFKFNMVGIKEGALVTFDPLKIEVKVVSDSSRDCIEYDGEVWTLTGFTKNYIPDEMKIPSGAYQGPKYFSYKGKTLVKLREEAEKKQK